MLAYPGTQYSQGQDSQVSSSTKADDHPLCNSELLKIKLTKIISQLYFIHLNDKVIFCSLPKIFKTDQNLKIIGMCILKCDKIRQSMVKTALLVAVSTSQ